MSTDPAVTYARLFAQAVARVIEDARWEARIAHVRDLERRAGFSNGHIGKRSNGGTPYNMLDLAQLAPVLGLSPAEIIERAQGIVGLPPGVPHTGKKRQKPA